MADDASSTYRPQRQAAARNREAILRTAHELFAADPAVSMNEIAKRAGVGAGTLYRHFPSREALLLEAYAHEVERLSASVGDVIAEHDAASEAFVDWFERLAAFIRVKHGLGDALDGAAAQRAIDATYAPVTAAIGALLGALVAEGHAAPGHDPADVLLLMSFLWRLPNDDAGRAQGRRITETVLDGLRP